MEVVPGSGFPLLSGSKTNPSYLRGSSSLGQDEVQGLDNRSTSYVYFIAALRADSALRSDSTSRSSGAANSSDQRTYAAEFDKQLQEVTNQVAAIEVANDSAGGAEISATATVQASVDAAVVDLQGVDGHLRATSIDFQYHATLSASYQGADGSAVALAAEVDVRLHIDFTNIASQKSQPNANQSDPLALDTDGDGQISLTDERTGPAFDINADGRVDRTSFVTGGDVFLALDRDGDGKISNGAELFGDQHGAANGFLELEKFDDNLDGKIDAADSIFSKLRGVRSKAGSLQQYSLASLGVASISLRNQQVNQILSHGNTLAQSGSYQTSAGENRLAADLLLSYRALGKTA